MKVISVKQHNITRINGTIPFRITSIGESEILEATKRLIPSGGVIKPIAKFTTMIKPKWIGSNPMALATGKRIGANTKIAGVVSMKQPTIKSKMLMRIKITTGLSDTVIIICVTMAGICSMVMILVKAVAQPKITMVVAVVEQEVPMALISFFVGNSR